MKQGMIFPFDEFMDRYVCKRCLSTKYYYLGTIFTEGEVGGLCFLI